ncbi:DNA primase [Halonotius terrestris]|uniref:DNA primase DnaG n=1 Tax=Halonotius terrestris TaxID=2487750 RepID=A0A8J8TCQ8_9EURY|nr:DNA primase DnaG [Halonotius terrestris]TQQ81264.1 DNA primase [Halonotius terrestris]
MEDTTKYLIHAQIAANGVVERNDVVGAVFGQTEGLLGDELDLRDLQESSKVGRIDVEISSENGQSFGEITIATSLDKAETAILGASLETIERIGPCRADIEISEIEDIRAAKRRAVVDRAKELLATAFDETSVSSADLVEDVRESVRVEDIVEYEGLPAGPSVATSDAVIVVEGRADVLQLLQYGIKNAIAVEGTDVPDAVADLTNERTTTVFVDGDRGGELILRELLQVGDVDFVAFAPNGRSVEDLSRTDVIETLRQKVAADRLKDVQNVREAMAGIVGDSEPPMTPDSAEGAGADADTEVEVVPTSSPASSPSPPSAANDPVAPTDSPSVPEPPDPLGDDGGTEATTDAETPATPDDNPAEADGSETNDKATADESDEGDDPNSETAEPATLRSHVDDIIGDGSGTARLLDAAFEPLADTDLDGLIDAIEASDEPYSLVLDGELSQRILDVAAQHGVDHIVARSTGEFVKKPVGTRVLTADELEPPEAEVGL